MVTAASTTTRKSDGKEDSPMAYLYRRGNVWWANISVDGRRMRLTTECTKRPDCEKLGKAKEGKLAGGEPTLPRADRVSMTRPPRTSAATT